VVRAVIFDLDGTLLDRKGSHERFMLDQAERFRADLDAVSPATYLAAAVRFDQNGTAPRKESFPLMGRELALSEALTETLMNDYLASFPSSCTLLPGVDEMLEALRDAGIRLGLITNGSARMQGGKLDAVALRSRLDVIMISETEELRKPDAEIFRRAAMRLEVTPSDCVFVGDNAEADVRGAKGAGMRAVWIRDAWWEEPMEADAVVDEVRELPSLIESWRT